MAISQKVYEALEYNALRVVLSILISIIYSVLVIRYLNIHLLGSYALLSSTFVIFTIPLEVAIQSPIIRFAPELIKKNEVSKLRFIFFTLRKMNLFVSVIATLFFLFGADFVFGIFGKSELAYYARVMTFSIIPGFLFALNKKILNSVYEQKFLNVADVILSVLELFMVVIFIAIFKLDLTGVIITYIFSYIIGSVISTIYIRKRHKYLLEGEQSLIDSEYKKRIIRYTVPLVALNIIYTFEGSLNNIFLGNFRSLEEVAFFDIAKSFVIKVFSLIWEVFGLVGVVSLSELSYSDPTKVKKALQQYVKIISLYAIPIAIGGTIIAEPLLITFYGEKVLPSIGIFRILILIYCFLNIMGISRTILQVKEKNHLLLIGNIFFLIMNIALSLWLIPSFGINGAIISTVTPSAILTSFYVCFVIFKLKIGNFFPFIAIGKYLSSSLLMGGIVTIFAYLLRTSRLSILISSITIGPLIYVMFLRLLGAFDQTDKRMVMNSKVPFKSTILKLLWKE